MEAVVKKKTWLLGWRDWQWEQIKRKYTYHKIIAWSNSHQQEHPEKGAVAVNIWDCRLWVCPRQHLCPKNRDKNCQGWWSWDTLRSCCCSPLVFILLLKPGRYHCLGLFIRDHCLGLSSGIIYPCAILIDGIGFFFPHFCGCQQSF